MIGVPGQGRSEYHSVSGSGLKLSQNLLSSDIPTTCHSYIGVSKGYIGVSNVKFISQGQDISIRWQVIINHLRHHASTS